MPAKIQLRRDTAANWGSNTLAAGEVGLEIDGSNVVVGVKVGGNPAAQSWSSLDYLAGTIPKRSSGSSDLNVSDFTKIGRFSFATASSLSNGPVTFVASDGAAHLLVTTHGSSDRVIQFLCTEGDGTANYPSKFYQRVSYGAATWRAWQPTSNWAFDASTGTPIACTTFEAKGVATFADGTAALPSITNNGDTNTGIWFPADETVAVSTNGSEAIRFNSNQQALFRDGTAALPAISNHDDPNTGVYFSNADEVSVATNGTQRAFINSAGLVSIVGNALIGGNLDMDNGSIQNLLNPTNAQDAATKDYVDTTRIGQYALFTIEAAGTIGFQRAGTVSNVFSFSGGNALTNLRASAGTWTGVIVGVSGWARYTISSGSSTLDYNASLGAATGVWAAFVRTA